MKPSLTSYILFLTIASTHVSAQHKPIKVKFQDERNGCRVFKQWRTAEEYFRAGNNRTKGCPMDSVTYSIALKDYESAVKLDANHWQARRNYARMLMHFARYTEAIEQLTLAAKNPKSKEDLTKLMEMRGEAYYLSEKYELAIPDFDTYITGTANNAVVRLLKAKALWKLGKTEEACKEYRKVIRTDPGLEKDKEFINCSE